ncbi:enoyl-CoA hydratase/isomerase family protein [Siccirubricoccus phaeus]|uniref:enoyl-CoA hydratase/isomerase family protein n=1 Tax=Siccirubricoccus phaeus TaxID=2595053 RepID=UPI0011F2FAF4|nr:enoyl-CoA hydratase/isomerase family protein [Siccirubricoccus phaeus]
MSTDPGGELVRRRREGAVLVLRLDNPRNRNGLDEPMRVALGAAVEEAESDPAVRAVYLTGAGPSFCAGGDLRMLREASDPWPVHRRFRRLGRWLVPLMTLEKPVVIGVNGHAVGGGMGLALTGDRLIAAEGAVFMAGFFRLGAIPDIGMMYTLPRLIGMARAKDFLFGGGSLTAAEALAIGLVGRVVPDAELDAAGLAEAQRLASGPAEVMGLAKILMARSFESSLDEMFAYEGLGQALAMSNPEFREGLAAMLDRRPAGFPAAAAAARR